MAHRWGVSLEGWPITVKILFENLTRQTRQGIVPASEIEALTSWRATGGTTKQFPFLPQRVVLHDYTGVPAVVDLAAMRASIASSKWSTIATAVYCHTSCAAGLPIQMQMNAR